MEKIGLQIAILGAIVVAALSVGFFSYRYSNSIANAIAQLATEDIRSNAEIQVSDLSNILANKIESVTSNLQVISVAPSIQDGDLDRAGILIDEGQRSTANFTRYYTWLDKDGKVLRVSNVDSTLQERFRGTDLSQREYFVAAKETLRPYYSTLIESVDGQARIYFSYPVVGQGIDDGAFKGAIVAASDLQDIGAYLKSQIPKKYQSSVSLTDREGTILYANNATLIGKNVFGLEVQAALPTAGGFKESFNEFLRESLKGEEGSGEFSVGGVNEVIAYSPVSIKGNDFGTLYTVFTPNTSTNIIDLLEQHSYDTLFLIATVGGIAVGAAYLVLTWNRKLEITVKSKTFELNAAAEKLREIDKSKEEFSSMITHELKTPLVPIIGYSNLLLEGRLGGLTKQQQEKVQIVYDNAQRLSKLIQDVLDVRKLELGRLKLNLEVVPVAELLERSLNALKPVANAKGVRLENALNGHEALQLKCDPDRIHQVLCNLIGNAIKFVPDRGGEIELDARLSQEGGSVVFSVRDNGIGIPEEKQQSLFNKFYQVDTSLTRNFGGTGLGLTIAKGLVEAHGGNIWVQSEQAKGSIFLFSIPRDVNK